jgi:hypothetical protein
LYVSPEVILNERGPFLGTIARRTNRFMDNLLAGGGRGALDM